MVSLPSFHSSQAPIPVKNGSPAETLLDRELSANGGVKPLLMDLRRTDPMLYEHSLLVWALTQRLLASLGYPQKEQTTIARAVPMHDVGKLTLPRSLLDKPARLSPQEYALMRQHPAAGARPLEWVGVAERITLLVYHHHERCAGTQFDPLLVRQCLASLQAMQYASPLPT